MNILDSIDKFLPQYLSDVSGTEIKEQLKKFPVDGTKETVYTTMLSDHSEIFQGDGLTNIPYYDSFSQETRPANVIILSNTCDISLENSRFDSINLCIAPLFNLEKYQNYLLTKGFSKQQIDTHIDHIKKQEITHVIYFPKNGKLTYDAIARLDKVCSIDRRKISSEDVKKNRLFTLSDYGFYLFLLKISIHFTRIRERIDRYAGNILPAY